MTKNEKLQEYFDFTEPDLKENSEGRVSKDQQLLVKNKLQNQINGILFVLLVLGFITVAINLGRSNDFAAFQKTLVIPAFIGVFAFLFILYQYANKSDFSLKFVEGKVNFVWVEERVRENGTYRTSRRLKMHVNDVSFDVQKDILEIIDQGDNVRFYYTGGGDIVSAEFVEK
jgi:hypothetical protein